jgi:hypothetical protein
MVQANDPGDGICGGSAKRYIDVSGGGGMVGKIDAKMTRVKWVWSASTQTHDIFGAKMGLPACLQTADTRYGSPRCAGLLAHLSLFGKKISPSS